MYRPDVIEGFEWSRQNGVWIRKPALFPNPRPRPFMFTCIHWPMFHDWTHDVEDECFFCKFNVEDI